MFVQKMKISLCRLKISFSETIIKSHAAQYNRKIDTVAKRASILEEMVKNKDKRKNWHFEIQPTTPKVRVFEGIHKPHRRRIVLNALFIRNITDILSTEEIVPELYRYGVEITGVQVSPCCKILNVFWQVPINCFESCDDIGKLLSISAPKIRAELISRNVLGRVPLIFFLRDDTNARIAEYEQAIKKFELEPKVDSPIVADESFVKDLMSFKSTKEIPKKAVEPVKNVTVVEEQPTIPLNPPDMKCNVFGLEHDTMMDKVIASKKKKRNPPEKSAVIHPETLNDMDDLFCKIPGVCFRTDIPENSESRTALLKKFQIERKMLREQHKTRYNVEKYECEEDDDEDYDVESNPSDDFLEETTIPNTNKQ